MSKDAAPDSRETRLAAKLRENLRRRKEQARGLSGNASGTEDRPSDTGQGNSLPKANSKS